MWITVKNKLNEEPEAKNLKCSWCVFADACIHSNVASTGIMIPYKQTNEWVSYDLPYKYT